MVKNWINKQVKERDWNKSRFAREIGVSRTHAGRLVNGVRQPSPELARTIARVFGVPEREVFEQTGLLKVGPHIMDEETRELIALIAALPPKGRDAMREIARTLHKTFPDEE